MQQSEVTQAFVPKRERILDAAEELFALHGYDGVTLRQIAKQAEVDVALANYHFGKKKDLFEATFLRRAQILNDLRLQALEKAEEDAAGNPSVEAIITAFLKPLQDLQMTGDRGWQNYCQLVAYVNASSVWGKELMGKNFDPLIRRYLDALFKSMPHAKPEHLHWCYHFLSGALTLTLAQTGRIDRLSDGLCQSTDAQTSYDLMVPFFVAGFERICEAQPA